MDCSILKPLFSKELVFFLNGNSRDEIIEILVEALEKQKKIFDKNFFLEAVKKREEIVTTGIGMGVAIPHAKLPDLQEFFIAVAVLERGVDWKALDNGLVRLVFLIGGPDNEQTHYLKILSVLTTILKDEEKRRMVLLARSQEEVIEVLLKNSA